MIGMGEIAIRVENIEKSFKVYFDKGTSLKEKLLFSERNRFDTRKVLQGIGFEVKKGEAVGIIGENGCGKSTLLKLLSRIMYPDSGSIMTEGRISGLIELGAGFHPDMSGRENIFINAAIFGLSRKEIQSRIDEIIEFSELGEYIDNPVRTYSSGMYMRLAFSVAINVDADILLVDEILAVGDAAFQAKCFNKLRDIKRSGKTIVIVSHSLGQIEQICDRSIWICDGSIKAEGVPRDIHPMYLEYMQSKEKEPCTGETAPETEVLEEQPIKEEPQITEEPSMRWGNRAVIVEKVTMTDSEGTARRRFKTGEPIRIVIEYAVHAPTDRPACGIGIFRNDGLQCYGTNTVIDRTGALELGKKGRVVCHIKSNQLLPGQYSLDVAFHTEDGLPYDYYRYAQSFDMYSAIGDIGVMRLAHEWEINSVAQ